MHLMPVEIVHPWSAGIAAALALAVAWAALRSGRSAAAPARSLRWRIVCLVLPGIAAVAALLAGAELTVQRGAGAARKVVLLVDLSGSARAAPWRDPQWLRRLALHRLAPAAQDHLTVVGFARQPHLLLDDVSARQPARWPSAWADFGADDATNVPAALAWRAPDERTPASAPRWLITDGLFPWPQKKLPAAATIVSPGADVGITAMQLRDGALWVQVRACADAATRDLVIRRNNQTLASQHLTFDHGPRTLWVNVACPPGPAAYDARLTADANTDLWPENDLARLIVPGPQAPRVLTLHPSDHLPGDAWKLAAEGWQVIELQELRADDLGRGEWQTLDTFVRDTGGGLILAGGNHAFGPGGYGGEPLAESLSPLWSGPHNAAPATVVFLLDASASMNEAAQDGAGAADTSGAESKFHVAARGVKAAMQLLAPDERTTVNTFTGTARAAADGTQRSLNATIDRSLGTIEPAGGTLPDTALPLAAKTLSTAPGDRKLVLLLTDGQVPTMDAPAWQKMLDAAGARLAIVAPTAARTGALETLAAHAAWLDGNDPAKWPALFRRAVAPIASGRARTDPLAWSSQTTPPLTGTANAWIETWARPESTLLASGHAAGGAATSWPAAAIAQRGLGRVAALPLAPDSPAAAALLDHLVHEVLPAPGDRRFTLAAARHDIGGWTVTADGTDAGKFLDHESLIVRIPDPATGELRDVPMSQTGPGHYVASVPSAAGAIVLRTAPLEKNQTLLIGRLQAASLASDEWPASTEAGPIPPGIALLAPTDHGPPWQPRTQKSYVDLSPWLWATAAIGAIAALWNRRSRR